MAHLLDFSKGKAAFVTFQAPAWHNLGTVFNRPLTLTDALNEGGLNYEVVKLPNIHRLPDNSEIISGDSFFTMRTDVNKVLGTRLGNDYTVYQNIDALNVVDEMLQSGKVTIETAGCINEGKKVFVCLKLNQDIVIGSNDMVKPYVLLANSHDGSLSITALPTNVRVVCNNTLTAALGSRGAYKIRHTANAPERVKEAFKILGLLESSASRSEDVYNRLRETIISKEDFFNYVGNVFMTDAEIKEAQQGKRIKELLSTRKENIINSVLDFANVGRGQNEALTNGSLNMWWAYNAVTGAQTGKRYSSADDRFQSLMFGNSANVCETALELAVAPEKVKPLTRKFDGGFNLN